MTALDGQFALVTGGTDGIGKATAQRLVGLGAEVLVIGRNVQKGEQALAEIRATSPHAKIAYAQYDLSLMHQVRALAGYVRDHHAQVDMLVHGAGVMLPKRIMTAEGLETVFAVQYFARHLLTQDLMPLLQPSSRVVNISAAGTIRMKLHSKNLRGEGFYSGVYILTQESIANDLLMLRLMRVHPAYHWYNHGPFYVRSGLFADMPLHFKLTTATFGRLMASTPQRAAADVVRLLVEAPPSGLYARNLKRINPTRYRDNHAVQDGLWEATQAQLGAILGDADHTT